MNTHVDYVSVIGDDQNVDELVEALERKFELRRLGETTYILGVRIERGCGKVYLSQTAYIEKLLQRFNLESTNEKCTPSVEDVKLKK